MFEDSGLDVIERGFDLSQSTVGGMASDCPLTMQVYAVKNMARQVLMRRKFTEKFHNGGYVSRETKRIP